MREDLQACLHDGSCPVVDLVVLVRVATDRIFHCLLDDFTDIVDNKQVLEGRKRWHPEEQTGR